jgi:hypothetical protein
LGVNASGDAEFVSASADSQLQEAVIWIPVADNQNPLTASTEYRFGVACRKQVIFF